MRSLNAKFVIAVGIFALAFSGFILYRTWSSTSSHIKKLNATQAAIALEFDLAIRDYIAKRVRPLMEEMVGEEEFIPETMSTSYVARRIFNRVQKKFPDYIIKFSSENPRNPLNRAGAEEKEIIEYFKRNPGSRNWVGRIKMDGMEYWAHFSARRFRESCLRCHGMPGDAPASLIARYGSNAGFHRSVGDVALDTVAVPMTKVNAALSTEVSSQLVTIVAGLVVFFTSIFLVFRYVVSNRLAQITGHFKQAAEEEEGAPISPITVKGEDEIDVLADSFNTLAAKLQAVHLSLEQRVEERTRELASEVKERRQAEEELKRQRAFLRQVMDINPNFIFAKDRDGRFTLVNQAVADAYGTTVEDLVGKTDADFNPHPEEVAGFLRDDLVVMESHEERIISEEKITDSTGRVRWLMTVKRPILNRHGIADNVLGVSTDITDRKLAEDTLREREATLSSIFRAAPIGIGMVADRVLKNANDHLCEMVGYLREELFNKSARMLYVNDEEFERVGRTKYEQIEKYGTGTVETRWKRKDGAVLEVRLSSAPIDPSDLSAGVTFTAMDITERRRAEKERERLEAQLRQAQKMEAIGTLAGGVAHDLNNILSGLVSYPQLLLMDLPEDSPLREPILTIQESGKKAEVIVQDMLTLARRGVAVSEVVNLNDIISEYMGSPEWRKLKSFHTNVRLVTMLEPNLLNVAGSPFHLSKIVMNLLSNAAEAMPAGGEIVISTRNQYVDKPIRGYDDVEEGDYVVLSVRDTGVGMSLEDQKRIFEPFYTKKVMGRSGTGLGMSVVWTTVKDHNGYIDIQSNEGDGTKFDLYFPVTREEVDSSKGRVSLEDYLGAEKILVIDDVEEQREIASRMLKKLGYEVGSVSSGEEAVEYMKHNRADLLVLDMIMDPGIDGLDTYKRIIEHSPGQRAVIASGFSETKRVKEAQRLGAGAYIKKPYTLEKLAVTVRNELDR